ncbi:MAG: PAS domain S-box protein, partial [Elusimicrobia bacterium]|nr:PAS domain S-box protein [Elusimicrobiota bacterium]
MRLRGKLLLIVLPTVAASMTLVAFFSRNIVGAALVLEVAGKSQLQARTLAQSPELVAGTAAGREGLILPHLLEAVRAGAVYAMVLEPTGRVLAHSDVARKGQSLPDAPAWASGRPGVPLIRRLSWRGRPVLEVAQPIFASRAKSGEEFVVSGGKAPAPILLGTLRLGAPLQSALDTSAMISRRIFAAVVAVNVLVLGVVLWLMAKVLRPVRLLAAAANRVGAGGLGETVPVLTSDEVGELALNFNRMSTNLAQTTVSRNTLDGILHNMLDGLLLADLDGRILRINPAALRLLGGAAQDWLGQPVGDAFADKGWLAARGGLSGLAATGSGQELESDLRSRTARLVPALLGVSALKGKEGQAQGYIIAFTDISARKESEEQSRRAFRYARSLIESSLDPLVTISPEGRITDANEATIKVTGVARKDLIGTEFSDFFTEPEKARAGYQQVFARGSVTDYPLTIRHQDGRLTDVLYNASVY